MKLFWKWHKIFWSIFTTVIVLLALLYGTLRAATPWIVAHPESVKKFLSDTLNIPTNFDQLTISWRVFGPTIKFSNLQLHSEENETPLVVIQRLELRYSLIRNVMSWDIYPRSTLIAGVKVSLKEIEANRWFLNGVALPPSNQPWYRNRELKQILDFVYSQKFFRIKNAQFVLQFFQKPSYQFNQIQLKLKRSYKNSTLYGSMLLQEKALMPVKFNAVFDKKPLLNHDWKGEVHLQLAKAHFTDWLSILPLPKNLELQKGDGIFSFWFQFAGGDLHSVTSEFDASNILINEVTKQKKFALKTAKGVVSWQRDSKHEWNVRAAPFHLLFNSGTNIPFDSELIFSKKYLAEKKSTVYELMIDKISISNLSTLLHFFIDIPATAEEWVTKLKPEGDLHDIRLQLPSLQLAEIQPDNILLEIGFNHLTTNSYKNFPALKNFQGDLIFTTNKGQISFDNQDFAVHFPNFFEKPIWLKDMVGSIEWQKTDKGLNLQAKSLLIDNVYIQTKNDVQFFIPNDNSSPIIKLQSSFQGENITNINKYMPVKMMNPKLATWLQQAIKNVKKISGQISLKGPLYDFPFDAGNGDFVAHANLEGVDLNYLPHWPQINDIDGTIDFHNRMMKIKAERAEILGAKLTKVSAVIPRITKGEIDWLSIHGETKTDLKNGIQFVQKTPALMQKFGGIFANMQGRGSMDLSLDLTVPITSEDIPTRSEAKIALNKGQLTIAPWKVALQDITGFFYFTEKSFVTNQVTAKLFNSPVEINVTTEKAESPQSTTIVTADGHIALKELDPLFNNQFSNFVKGETDYHAKLTVPHQSPTSFLLEIFSNLQGVAIQLPTPFTKKADSKTYFRFALNAPKFGQTTLLTLSYSKQWNALLLFANEKTGRRLDKAVIGIGPDMPELPKNSVILLTGYMPTLPIDEWQKFSKQFSERNAGAGEIPFVLDMRSDQFELGGVTIPKPRIQIKSSDSSKLISIDSSMMTGTVEIPNDAEDPLNIKLERLVINSNTGKDTSDATTSIDQIPSMKVLINQFHYNNKNFGRVKFTLNKRNKNAINIDNLEVIAPHLTVTAQGKWMTKNTELTGILHINRLSRLLQAWGLPPAINSKRTEVKFNLNWNGSPLSFALTKLNGVFDLTMMNGSIEQLDQSTEAKLGIGKLLSIMSLQTLPRLFTFDFSAVTNKGFTFDRLTSRFLLKMGNATTNDLEIDGPAARVEMKGRIGLAAEDYDVTVRIHPHVTQGIPVVAAFAGGPIAGATALVVNQLIGDKVVGSMVSYSYTLKGSWQKPVVQERQEGVSNPNNKKK